MMKARWITALVFGVALGDMACDRKPPDQLSGTPKGQVVAGLARELALDLGDGVMLKLVPIPAGKFLMGSPETEKDRAENETQHEVTISKPFYLGSTPVTVDQFAAFVKDSEYETEAEKAGASLGIKIQRGRLDMREMEGVSWRRPSFDQQPNHPVVQVSWEDAKAFCDWLSEKSGKKVVLPTEAQWEYACRAGSKTAYPWGNNPDGGKGWANCADLSLKSAVSNVPAGLFFKWDDGFVFTSPVGSFKPNAFGLYDMIGNVFEWCEDGYGDYEKGPATDPTRPDTDFFRVLRGGAWTHLPQRCCRSASRFRGLYFGRCVNFGFRVAVDP